MAKLTNEITELKKKNDKLSRLFNKYTVEEIENIEYENKCLTIQVKKLEKLEEENNKLKDWQNLGLELINQKTDLEATNSNLTKINAEQKERITELEEIITELKKKKRGTRNRNLNANSRFCKLLEIRHHHFFSKNIKLRPVPII
ncbi:MAG: hypothetical protein LBJ32_01685 [Oscillospiraceae bacterium]|jgi:DNA repair exonuclease SbcCD ATPase subunit|nr:hypothetical protein [Oscillospiraceae bacterium]